MDIQHPPEVPPDRADEHEPTWAEMNERLKVLQDKYVKARVASEPRSFATRFRD